MLQCWIKGVSATRIQTGYALRCELDVQGKKMCFVPECKVIGFHDVNVNLIILRLVKILYDERQMYSKNSLYW